MVNTTYYRKPIIAVEGIIGAGKTTFTKIAAKKLNLRDLYEPVDNNPYLKMFYENPKRWAFPMQMELMYRRFAMHKLASWESVVATDKQGSILDRSLPGDRVFAKLHAIKGNISPIEWKTYENTFHILSKDFNPPRYMIFLDVDPELAYMRSRGATGARNRDQESVVEDDEFYAYLHELDKEYKILVEEIEENKHEWANYTEIVRIDWSGDLSDSNVNSVMDSIQQLIFKDKEEFSEIPLHQGFQSNLEQDQETNY